MADELLSSLVQPYNPEPRQDISFGELTAENFKNFNSVMQIKREAEDTLYSLTKIDRSFDPFEQPEFKNYEQFADSFTNVYNREQFDITIKKIDDEIAYYQLADKASVAENLASDLLIGISDPINYIAVGGGARAYSLARSAAAKDAAKTAALSAGLTSTASEGISQATMETRGAAESAIAVSASALLGGVLGGAVGFLSKPLKEVADGVENELDLIYGTRSIGAAQVSSGPQTTIEQETLVGAAGLEKLFANDRTGIFRSPTLSLMNSSSLSARKAVQELAEIPNPIKKFVEGIAAPEAAESIIRQYNVLAIDTAKQMDKAFLDYRQSGAFKVAVKDIAGVINRDKSKPFTAFEFREDVGRALENIDNAGSPQAASMANYIRNKVFEPMRQKATNAGLLPEDLPEEFAQSYFTRIYNQEMIAAERPDFELSTLRYLKESQQNVDKYHERVSTSLDSYNKRLEQSTAQIEELSQKLKEKSLTKARKEAIRQDIKMARANKIKFQEKVKKLSDLIEENRIFASMSEAELRDLSSSITDNILGQSLARSHYNLPALKHGPLRSRTFHIPTEYISRWTEKDALNVVNRYVRSVGADITLTEKFGRADLQDQIDAINADYASLIDKMKKDGATAKDFSDINRKKQLDLNNIEAIRDRLLGKYAMPSTPQGMVGRRIGKGFASYNVMTSLGMIVGASLPDMASAMMTHGFTRMFKGTMKNFSKRIKRLPRPEKREAELSGTIGEAVLHNRANAIGDIFDPYTKGTKLERALNYGANRSIALTGFNIYVDGVREIIGGVSIDRSMRAIQAIATGGKISQKEVKRLAMYGFNKRDAKRVYKQFKKYGKMEGGEFIVNSDAWDDRALASKWHSALGKEILKANIEPGQEKPLWLSTGMGSVIGQFKSFITAANQRILIAGLQSRDLETLQGLVGMVGLGMLVTYLRVDQEYYPDSFAGWVREGVDRSGALGWIMEVNNVAEKITGNRVGVSAMLGIEPSSRFNSRSALGSIFGPSIVKAEDALNILYSASTGDMKDSDVRRIRRMIPLQNNMFLRGIFDEVEDSYVRQGHRTIPLQNNMSLRRIFDEVEDGLKRNMVF